MISVLATDLKFFREPVVCMLQESVRAAAITLARTLRSLTLRLADSAQTSPADSAAAVAAAVPLLLEKGLPSSVGEVQGLTLDTLAKLVKAAAPKAIRPHLPALIGALLESLSGMEVSLTTSCDSSCLCMT